MRKILSLNMKILQVSQIVIHVKTKLFCAFIDTVVCHKCVASWMIFHRCLRFCTRFLCPPPSGVLGWGHIVFDTNTVGRLQLA